MIIFKHKNFNNVNIIKEKERVNLNDRSSVFASVDPFKYNFILVVVWSIILVCFDPVTFVTTNCSGDGSSLNEVLDAYYKFLNENAIKPPHLRTTKSWDITEAETRQVLDYLSNEQKASIDSHLFNKFTPEELNSDKSLVKSHIRIIMMAYKYYLENRP